MKEEIRGLYSNADQLINNMEDLRRLAQINKPDLIAEKYYS